MGLPHEDHKDEEHSALGKQPNMAELLASVSAGSAQKRVPEHTAGSFVQHPCTQPFPSISVIEFPHEVSPLHSHYLCNHSVH